MKTISTAVLLLMLSSATVAQHSPADRTPQATPQDVASPDAIVSAFLSSGSGPAGPRDFGRMRSLFAPAARVITIRRSKDGPAAAVSRSIDEYIEQARGYLASNGNYERVVKKWVERYANFAHVFCAFEARKSPKDNVTYRGVGSFQLLWDGGRWWILTAYWQGERPGDPLPARYRR